MSSEQTIRIIWPEVKSVPVSKIAGWYADEVANGNIGEDRLGLTDPYEQALALDDSGFITLRMDRLSGSKHHQK